MPACPFCDEVPATDAALAQHAALAHPGRLLPGTTPPAPPPPAPPIAGISQWGSATPPPPLAGGQWGSYGAPPPGAWAPPSSPPPPSAGERTIPIPVVVTIVVVIVAVTIGAVLLTNRGDHHTADRFVGSTTPDSTPAAPAAPVIVDHDPTSPDAVTPAEAGQVASQLWPAIRTALEQRDPDALRAYEDGPLLEVDTAFCQAGCPPKELGDSPALTVSVPHQSTWPAVFFLHGTYACPSGSRPSCARDLVIRQEKAGGPWKAVLGVSYWGVVPGSGFSVGQDGYTLAPQPAATARGPALLADFAAYRQSMKDTGRPPASTSLASNDFTSGIHIYESADEQTARGLRHVVDYRADPQDDVFSFRNLTGTTVCGTIRFRDVTTPVGRSALSARDALGEYSLAVPPGDYASLTGLGVRMVCFAVVDGQPVVYVAGDEGTTTVVTGRPT